jgi:hypothetical protein
MAKSLRLKMNVTTASVRKAVLNLTHTTVTGESSVTAIFSAMARNPQREAVTDAYNMPFELSVMVKK